MCLTFIFPLREHNALLAGVSFQNSRIWNDLLEIFKLISEVSQVKTKQNLRYISHSSYPTSNPSVELLYLPSIMHTVCYTLHFLCKSTINTLTLTDGIMSLIPTHPTLLMANAYIPPENLNHMSFLLNNLKKLYDVEPGALTRHATLQTLIPLFNTCMLYSLSVVQY